MPVSQLPDRVSRWLRYWVKPPALVVVHHGDYADATAGPLIDLSAPTAAPEVVSHRMGTIDLTGKNVVTIEVASGTRVAIDGLRFDSPDTISR